MNRRAFLCLLAACRPVLARRSTGLLLSEEDAARIRDAAGKDPALSASIRKLADAALRAGPWSVAWHRPERVKTTPNDYCSEGPYWWPDPMNPGGPYIRRDGERNPARFIDNRRDLGEMCDTVLALGMSASFLNNAACAEHAAKVLSVWFLDPKTRMNPNLEFGQAVPGRNTGRGTGIIDTVALIDAAQGIHLLERTAKFDAAAASGVRRWFAEYLRWMTGSEKGLDEKKATNNHATWWTAQAAAYATLVGDEAAKAVAWDRYRTYLLPSQVQPDGSCPREEARTRSLSYSSMNLDGFSVLCRIAELNGVDLWRFHTAKGIGIERSFHYLMPYVLQPRTWRKQQITSYDQDRSIFPALGGLGLRSEELLAAYRRLPRAEAPRVLLVDLLVHSAQ